MFLLCTGVEFHAIVTYYTTVTWSFPWSFDPLIAMYERLYGLMKGFGIIVATIHISYKIMCPSFFATYIWWFLVKGQLHVSCICMKGKVPSFNFRWLYIHRNQQRKHYIGFILHALGNCELMQGCLLSTLNFSFMLFCKKMQKSNIHKKHENKRFKIYNLKHRL